MPDVVFGPRERMVYSAAQLVRAQGVAATGVREVIEHSDTPRGSFQHYFPGGKDQLVGEAVVWAGDFAAGWVRSYRDRTRKPTPAGLFAHVVGWWKQDFTARGFRRGCPLMATVADRGGQDSSLDEAARTALDTWERALTSELVRMDVSRRRARRLATVMLSALEGAIMIARVRRSTEPFDAVVAGLRPLLETAPRRVTRKTQGEQLDG